jgi:hypothetical protein
VKRSARPFVALVAALVPFALVAGCAPEGPRTGAGDTTRMTVEEKIKNLEKADLPAPAKQAALAKLRAEQAKGRQ